MSTASKLHGMQLRKASPKPIGTAAFTSSAYGVRFGKFSMTDELDIYRTAIRQAIRYVLPI